MLWHNTISQSFQECCPRKLHQVLKWLKQCWRWELTGLPGKPILFALSIAVRTLFMAPAAAVLALSVIDRACTKMIHNEFLHSTDICECFQEQHNPCPAFTCVRSSGLPTDLPCQCALISVGYCHTNPEMLVSVCHSERYPFHSYLAQLHSPFCEL